MLIRSIAVRRCCKRLHPLLLARQRSRYIIPVNCNFIAIRHPGLLKRLYFGKPRPPKMTEKSTGEISSSNKDEICKENGQENEPTPRYGALRFQPKYSTSHVSGEITYPPANQTAEKDVEMRNSANHMHYKDTMSSTEDRDPGRINEEIKIQFEDVFAEPEGTHSFDPIWNASFLVFTKSKLWCYRILSSVCGVPCALYWGIHFACLGFAQIWIYTPGLKSFSIQVLPAARIFSVCMRWFVAPWCEACGKIFSGIRIQKLSK